MAAADYRLMTEATGQRIAAALEALHLATVTGVKGNAEANYRTGDVNITPANIGAVAKSGDTMTGRLTISLGTDGDQGRINFSSPGVAGQAQLVANTTGTQQRITFVQFTPDGTSFEEYALPNTADYTGGPALRNILTDKYPVTVPQGGTGATTAAGARQNFFPDDLSNESVAYMAGFTTGWVKGGWLQLPLPLPYGGTGATTSAVTITNDYSSVLNVINAVKGTRIFPISIQKNQSSSYSDMPSGNETDEWNLLLVGDSTRMTANLYIFRGDQNPKMYLRHVYNGAWLSNWTQVV